MTFATALLAVMAALGDAAPLSSHTEYAGVVYQCGDTFGHSKPRSTGSGDQFEARITYPKACKVVAIYHTHPYGRDSERFSRDDIDAWQQLRVDSYVGVLKTREVRQLVTKDDACGALVGTL